MCCEWYDQNILSLRCNNGLEYLSEIFESYLESKGAHHELAVTNSNEQNGVAESARSMIVNTGLLDKSCAEPMECAAYISNLTTSTIKGNRTPLEVWSGKNQTFYTWKFLGVWRTHMCRTHRGSSLIRRQWNSDSLATLFSPCATDCLMWRHHQSM